MLASASWCSSALTIAHTLFDSWWCCSNILRLFSLPVSLHNKTDNSHQQGRGLVLILHCTQELLRRCLFVRIAMCGVCWNFFWSQLEVFSVWKNVLISEQLKLVLTIWIKTQTQGGRETMTRRTPRTRHTHFWSDRKSSVSRENPQT